MRSALFYGCACVSCAVAMLAPSWAMAQAPASAAPTAETAPEATTVPGAKAEPPAPDQTRHRYGHYVRVKRAGWVMAGVSFVGFLLTTVIYTKTCRCDPDEFLCFCDPAAGAVLGAVFFGPPFIAGIVMGSIGTARAKRYREEHPILARLQIGIARNGFSLAYRF